MCGVWEIRGCANHRKVLCGVLRSVLVVRGLPVGNNNVVELFAKMHLPIQSSYCGASGTQVHDWQNTSIGLRSNFRYKKDVCTELNSHALRRQNGNQETWSQRIMAKKLGAQRVWLIVRNR